MTNENSKDALDNAISRFVNSVISALSKVAQNLKNTITQKIIKVKKTELKDTKTQEDYNLKELEQEDTHNFNGLKLRFKGSEATQNVERRLTKILNYLVDFIKGRTKSSKEKPDNESGQYQKNYEEIPMDILKSKNPNPSSPSSTLDEHKSKNIDPFTTKNR